MARSRRTTPSAQASVPAATEPPGRTRTSRSRTHEAAPVPATQPAQTRRSARAKSVESNVSVTSHASRTRRRIDAPQEILQVDLATVEEGSDVEDVDLEIPPPDDIPEVRATLEVDIDESAIGDRSLHSMSGTTVREQQSDAGDDELNPHALLTYGPTVYHTATNLIQRFDQHKPKLRQVLKGIDQPGSSTEVAFRKDVAAFQNAVLQLGEAFGGAVGLLNPDHVMEALFKQSRPSKASGSWRVTELMQLRNLAILVREVASTPIETDEMADKLSRLNVQFPLAFLDDFNMSEDSPAVMGNSYLQDDTFEVAFAIRLQTAVMEIQREFNSDGFDVGDFIHSSFYASAEDQDNLLAWDVNGLGSGDLGLLPSYANKMRAKIQLLISCVANDIQDIADGSEEGMQTLARNFPWSDFRVTLLRWAKLRMEEITASIDGANEVEGLMEEVRADLSRDDAFEPDGVASPPRSPTKQRVNVAAARTQIRQPSVSVLPISPLRHTDGNANSNRSTQGDDDGAFQHIDEIEVARDPEIVELMGTIDENQRQRKENIRTQPAVTAGPAQRRKFVDEQADAERISNFDDATQQSPNQHRRPHSLAQTSPGKRKRIQTITEEYNVSDDDGYQTDSREVDMSQRRHEAPRLGPSPKKVRIHAPDCRRRDGSTQTAEAEEDERVVEYRYQKRIMSSQAARSSQSAPQRPRLQQGRSRWSPAEELRLEELISEHGCSWAYLKSIDVDGDNMFEGRDQVALKDKARNMKTQMIVEGLDPLPLNWDLVPLDKKAIDRILRGRDIDVGRLLRAGLGVDQLWKGGISIGEFLEAGITKQQLVKAGISHEELK